MSKIRLHGSSSGYTEIAPVAASGNNTITLPNDGTIISKDSAGAIGVTSVHTTKLVSTGTINSDGGAITAKAAGVPVVLNSTNDNDFKIEFQNSSTPVSFIGGSSSNLFRVGNASASSVLEVDSSSNLKFNSGYGSVATAYGVRAWATIDGTGTVNNRASGNVTSTTDNGTGDYTVNFTTNFPDANYTVACAIPVINDQGATYGWGLKHDNAGQSSAPTSKTASECRFQARRESDFDIDSGHVMFVR